MVYTCLCHRVENRACRPARSRSTPRMGWGGGWGGVGMMTFLALAHMVDATQVMGWGGVGLMTFLALATLTWQAWSMLRNRWWGGVGWKSIVDLARMVNATQQMVGWWTCKSKGSGKTSARVFQKDFGFRCFRISRKNLNGTSSCLLTDGAPCYQRVAKECKAKHFYVNHSAGEFERTERFRNKSLSAHKGTIDSCWKQMKTHIPKSLGSQSKQVPLRIRSWQWRFTHADHSDLFSLCGTQVAKMWHKRNQRVKFQRRCRHKQIQLKKGPTGG